MPVRPSSPEVRPNAKVVMTQPVATTPVDEPIRFCDSADPPIIDNLIRPAIIAALLISAIPDLE